MPKASCQSTRGNGNHRHGIAFITATTRLGSQAPEIRNRAPLEKSSSVSGTAADGAAEVGGLPGSGPAIATGVKPIGFDAGEPELIASQNCLRQVNSMLRLTLCNAADCLALDKRFSHQRPLLVLAPALPGLAQNKLHSASACDRSYDPSLK
jgi:hypothetical protein